MTEQRTDRIETPDGNTHTTTIVTDEPRRSGVSGWFLMFVVLLAVIVALWVFVGQSKSEMAKDDAVSDAAAKVNTAAEEVGNAAAKVGDAASDTAAAAKNTARNAADEAQSAASEAAE